MATYISYTPLSLFDKALFNFPNYQYKYSGTIKVSLSDGFAYAYYSFGLLSDSKFTMYPYSGEINWDSSDVADVQNILSVLSSFANLNFRM